MTPMNGRWQRHRVWLPASFLLLAAIIGGNTTAAGTGAREPGEEATVFEFRRSALLDLHMLVRSLTAAVQDDQDLEGLAAAVDSVRRVERAMSDPMLWGIFEPLIAASTDAVELRAALARLPESQRLRDGREVRLRGPLLEYAETLEGVEPAFLERRWPEHEAEIKRAEQRLRRLFAGREEQCVAYVVSSLGMTDPVVRIPVYLVVNAPPPQAFTHRGRDGAVCIVGISEQIDSLLAEMVVHEVIHVLDLATAEGRSALNDLRAELQRRGLGPGSAAYRDVPHTLMFVQAAETVRRLLQPEHQHYGEARGYYEKVPGPTSAVRESWQRYLDGEVSREAAVAEIVQNAADQGSRPARAART